jgi:ketosteroid isomerase-like protein
MEQEEAVRGNIEIVRQLYAAFSKGDIEGILSMLCDDVVWSEPENPYNPAGGTRHGHAGFLEWMSIGRDAEEIQLLEPERFLADKDGVAVVGHFRVKARETGRIYESDFVHLIALRDHKIAAFQEFFDTYAAGEAFRSGA